jgi:hypothetical protein
MSDITATVLTNTNINASIDVQSIPTVSAVGIQGLSATQTGMAGIADVDAVNPINGSLLIYKTTTNKWTASTTLDAQNMEGGEF